MPIPLRVSQQPVSPYDQRPTTTGLLPSSDQGRPSSYAGAKPVTDVGKDDMLKAIERRLSPMEQRRNKMDSGISGRSKDNKGLPDNLQPSYMRGSK